jgi:serine/threonine protein phosphatase PrpC
MKFALVQDSRLGARRMNQDRVGHWRTPQSLLLVVADGMGGHLHGEVAANLAADLFGASFQREAKPKLANPAEFLAQTIAAAHALILAEAQKRGLAEPPRTVIVACVVQDGHATWTHVGDCRLYLFRKGRVAARTRDHTRVQELVDAGRIRGEAVTSHPERNRLLQCLGGFQPPQPGAASKTALEKDDILLLCSDGFWGPLTQRQMLNALLARELKEAVPELVELAEARAGHECDNVSVLAVSWGEELKPAAAAAEGPSTLPYYELPTDVQDLTATDPDFLRVSDDDIDKAIAEIKAALRKNVTPRR